MTEPVDLGSYTIDPRSILFNIIAAQSKPTNGYSCLVSNYFKNRRPDLKGVVKGVFFNNTPDGWTFSLTHGDYRYTRMATEGEAALALNFDFRNESAVPQKKVKVSLDLTSGEWSVKPKDTRKRPQEGKEGGGKGGSINRDSRSRRGREFRKIQQVLKDSSNPEATLKGYLKVASSEA